MTRSDNGTLILGPRDMAKVFLAMLSATTIPLVTGVGIFYGDNRVMENDISELKVSDKSDKVILQSHENRLTVIETKEKIEQ